MTERAKRTRAKLPRVPGGPTRGPLAERSARLDVSLSPADLDWIKAAAETLGMSASKYAAAILHNYVQEQQYRAGTHPHPLMRED